jgi:hypothetical protein
MSPRHGLARMVAISSIAALLAGCSTSAAIERRNGSVVYGHIDYSDEQRLYVTDEDGRRVGLERSDVVDIDHPGRIGRTVGGITTGVGFGILMLTPLARACSTPGPEDPSVCWDLQPLVLTFGIGVLLVGVPVLVRNLAALSRSRAAAKPRSWTPVLPPPARLQSR